MSSVVIKVENIYKEYRLGEINHGTLAQDLQSWWARIRGKEDPNSSILQEQNMNVKGNKFLALECVSFDIKAGERVGIIGRNGAGKSTLLKILSRITMPTKGTIKIKGRIGSLLEVGTGFHPELTGRENIYLNGCILGMKKKEIDKKFDEIVDFSGIEKYIDTPVKRYSSGMAVRLGFAIAAHLEPEILIVDEVLAVGDAEFQRKALGKMESVSTGEGRTVLFVSHNMSSIQKLCTRGLLLNNGKLIKDDHIDSVVNDYIQMLGVTQNINKHEFKGLQVLSIKHYSDNRKGNYTPDSGLIAEVLFYTKSNIKSAFFNLHIEDYDGRSLIHARTDWSGLNPSFTKGMYRVFVQIPRICLKAGNYLLWFRIYIKKKDREIIADSEKVPLKIDGTFIGGLLKVDPKWEWQKI